MRSGVSRVEIPQKWCGQLQQRASSAGCASLDGAARQNLGPDQAGISCQTAPTPERRLLGGAQQDAEMVQNLCTPVGGVENRQRLGCAPPSPAVRVVAQFPARDRFAREFAASAKTGNLGGGSPFFHSKSFPGLPPSHSSGV